MVASPTVIQVTHGLEGGREEVGRSARVLRQMRSRGGLKATHSTYGRSFGCSEDVANQRHPIYECNYEFTYVRNESLDTRTC
eukprot:COSAG02_NODE_11599_length_1691_cov_2.157035_2_plen_81_part_01